MHSFIQVQQRNFKNSKKAHVNTLLNTEFVHKGSSNGYNFTALCCQQLSFGKFQADEQGWVDTIKSVGHGGTVMINTMDWLGQSQFTKETVYWSTLSSAISEVISTYIPLSFCFVFGNKFPFGVVFVNLVKLAPKLLVLY